VCVCVCVRARARACILPTTLPMYSLFMLNFGIETFPMTLTFMQFGTKDIPHVFTLIHIAYITDQLYGLHVKSTVK
jgi:hypothetical protein